jgi:hypothetical protein
MSSKRQPSRGKKLNPHFWVFCEGKTEEAYVCFLRSKYRLPLEVVTKIAGCDINSRFIQSFKKGKPTHAKDRNFLIYDADIQDVLENLKKINDVTLITSNPAIELWFLLHFKNQTSLISIDECLRELSKRIGNNYKKGIIDEKLKTILIDKCREACKRAKQLEPFKNPSTNMYLFIEALENAVKNKNI